jgi:hypothetical protein
VISAIGRAPKRGTGEAEKPFELAQGALGLRFAPLLVEKLVGDGVEGVGRFGRPHGFDQLLGERRVSTFRQEPLGLFTRLAGFPKAGRGIDADGKQLLASGEPIG